MKMTLKPIQSRILVKLGTARQLSFTRLAEVAMPSRKLDPESRSRWDNEIRLQIELLGLYGLIQIEEQMGIRTCTAPEFVVRWVPDHLKRADAMQKAGKKYRPSIVLPLIAASLVAVATTACSNLPGMKQDTPAPVVSPYNATGTPPPERMEQFYNPQSNSMVYRFCVGSECPAPTPKKPKPTMAVVTEIDNTGASIPVDQKISPTFSDKTAQLLAKPVGGVVKDSMLKPKTAMNDKGAAAVAAQLEQQRRAILEASGAAQAPTTAPTAAKLSVKTLQDAGAPVFNKPTPQGSPAAPGAVRKDKSPVQDMLPTTGTRVPTGPQAKADTPAAPVLAKATTADRAVGGIAQHEMVTETSVRSTAPEKAGSPEAFLLGWADLWSAKNADAFFGLYAKDFWPTYGDAKSFGDFEHQRRNVMTRAPAIKVGVEVVKIDAKDDKATVRFWQNYESKTFKSRVMKSLELVKVDGDWKIRRERLIPVPQNPIA